MGHKEKTADAKTLQIEVTNTNSSTKGEEKKDRIINRGRSKTAKIETV